MSLIYNMNNERCKWNESHKCTVSDSVTGLFVDLCSVQMFLSHFYVDFDRTHWQAVSYYSQFYSYVKETEIFCWQQRIPTDCSHSSSLQWGMCIGLFKVDGRTDFQRVLAWAQDSSSVTGVDSFLSSYITLHVVTSINGKTINQW